MSITIDKKGKQIADRGEKIYFKIKSELEKKYNLGDYVTIEVKTGKYFIGKTSIDAYNKAHKIFPKEIFFLANVGSLTGKML